MPVQDYSSDGLRSDAGWVRLIAWCSGRPCHGEEEVWGFVARVRVTEAQPRPWRQARPRWGLSDGVQMCVNIRRLWGWLNTAAEQQLTVY